MYNYSKQNKQICLNLRKNLTPWEWKLWFDFLKNCGYKFYKQRRIGDYVVDFYCAKAKLVVELDGSQHYLENNIEKDETRTKYLKGLGITVLRYSNLDVDKNFNCVCEDILKYLNNQKPM